MVLPRLKNSPDLWRLARDLGIHQGSDPVVDIVGHAVRRVRRFLRKYPCATLTELLDMVAANLETEFVCVNTDDEVDELERQQLSHGETGFLNLRKQLGPTVYGITFRRLRAGRLDRSFISVIDCRGDKRHRAYFTKWHELAHLLTLTDQRRLKFLRSHAPEERKDPEEALMDIIAGEVAFLPEIVTSYAEGRLTFYEVERLRDRLCPDCSRQAALLGLVRAWPQPVLLLDITLGLKASEALALEQGRFGFSPAAVAVPRATRVTINEAAKMAGLRIHPNMRVPSGSVIYQVFSEAAEHLYAFENLDMWSSSDGSRLPSQAVHVEARRLYHATYALIAIE